MRFYTRVSPHRPTTYIATGRWTHFLDTKTGKWSQLELKCRAPELLKTQGEVISRVGVIKAARLLGAEIVLVFLCDLLGLLWLERKLLSERDDTHEPVKPETWEPMGTVGLEQRIISEEIKGESIESEKCFKKCRPVERHEPSVFSPSFSREVTGED